MLRRHSHLVPSFSSFVSVVGNAHQLVSLCTVPSCFAFSSSNSVTSHYNKNPAPFFSSNNINCNWTSYRFCCSSSTTTTTTMSTNPLLEKSPLPFEFPQFDKIKNEHFAPAFEAAMKEHSDEILAIANNESEEPTFENTVAALDECGQKLARIHMIFSNLNSCNTNDELQKLDVEISPKLQAHKDSMFLNAKLFKKVQALYEKRDTLGLDQESSRLLWRYHLDFVRAGASLTSEADKEKLKTLNSELATLETQMQQAILAEVADSAVWVDKEADLEGLTADELESARKAADAVEESKRKGAFLIKLRNTTQQPVFVSLKNAETRKKILAASLARGCRGGQHDSRKLITTIARKRAERAQLLGFANHAAFQLADEMIGSPQKAIELLARVAKPAMRNALKEAEELKTFSGRMQDFASSDWDHYAEQLRAEKYSFDESMLKPYFELENVLNNAVFFSANKLYGLTFTERHDLPVYHPTVKVYDVKQAEDDTQVAIFILDLYARDNKQGGAWMNNYVEQKGKGTAKFQVPIVGNHMNLDVPAAGKPTLVALDDCITLAHEHGHFLHGALSNVRYSRFEGTNVPRDFVELPSQLNENFMLFPEVVKNYKHHETGEVIPDELIAKVRAASKFNQGYATTEYLAAALLDQAWHALKPEEVPEPDKVEEFEAAALERVGLKSDLVPPRYRSTYFAHIFAGGYSACYASYIVSEVLDADCEQYFKTNGGMTRENGNRFRRLILEKGGSDDPDKMIKEFLGRDPSIEPLMERRGLN